jgi:protein TonB
MLEKLELAQVFRLCAWTSRADSGAIADRDPMTAATRKPLTPSDAPPNARAGVLVDVAVLTGDLGFYESVRSAVGERNPVWRARSAEETADLLLTGRCGVLLIDLAAVTIHHETLINRVLDQFPDLVIVAAGKREDDALLSTLISDGRVFRFLHLPPSAQRTAMFLDAAIKEHVERRSSSVQQRLRGAMPQLDGSGIDWRKAAFVGGGVLAFVGALALAWQLSKPRPPATAEDDDVTAATVAGGADPVLSRARAALAAGRYESPTGRNALDLYSAVLLARPDEDEARLGLKRTVESILAQAATHVRLGRDAEARRLVERVRLVAPQEPAVRKLTAQLDQRAAANIAPESVTDDGGLTEAIAPVVQSRRSRAVPIVSAGPAVHGAAIAPPATAQSRAGGPVVAHADPLAPKVSNVPGGMPAPWQQGRTLEQRNDPASVRPVAAVATSPSGGGVGLVSVPDDAKPIDAVGFGTTGSVTAPENAPAPAAAPVTAAVAAVPNTAPTQVAQRRVRTVQPEYPAAALSAGREGRVELSFSVDAAGKVQDVRVVQSSPPGVFDDAARRAVRQWRYAPRDGLAVSTATVETVELKFELD